MSLNFVLEFTKLDVCAAKNWRTWHDDPPHRSSAVQSIPLDWQFARPCLRRSGNLPSAPGAAKLQLSHRQDPVAVADAQPGFRL